ncbi:jg7252 [Pararge aegeria aegeria]|uniref:Lipase n=1 Tax=Pararge aegeria aegeria TaxID=348720 RepID=A0A8S4S5K0_9NEOP|nr:jg7252 [Pararge aegeria aegeria]
MDPPRSNAATPMQVDRPYYQKEVNAKLFLDLSSRYGHPAVKYDVITEDGYILNLFHLPGKRKPPVLLTHGLFCNGDSWILRGNTSLPIILANAGHDVWIGNCRGNVYSKRHIHLDPNSRRFWNFSFHEQAIYDLSVMIDTVLEKTGTKKINAIGHSLGNTIFYVLGSTKTEYNGKVNLLIALSPISYLNNVPRPAKLFFELAPFIGGIMQDRNVTELFGPNGIIKRLIESICFIPTLGYKVCVENLLFNLVGFDENELGSDFSSILFSHFPSSVSLKNLLHLAQVYNIKRFARYDYGLKNIFIYNTSFPPRYDLDNVKMPVALIAAKNDRLCALKDVEILRSMLANVVSYLVIPWGKFNHVDYIWGESAHMYLYPYILSLLDKYSR